MTPLEEFSTAFLNVLGRWPRVYKDPALLQLILEEVQHLSFDDKVRVSKHLVGSSSRAPLVPDFRKAIETLRLKPKLRIVDQEYSPVQHHAQRDNLHYWLTENCWANDKYIFTRSMNVRDCSFFLKTESPKHPLVILDSQVREQRLSEIRKAIERGTYSALLQKWGEEVEKMNVKGMRNLNPKDGIGRSAT